jgi:hypothetical protein
MNRSSVLAFGLIGAFMLAGSASAQTGSSTSQTDADRVSRRCTTGTLAPGSSAQCSDDAVYDGPLVAPSARGAVGVDINNPALPANPESNPPTVPPVVGGTNPASPGNPASVGNPGSLSTTPPSLSNNPPSLNSPGNTPGAGSGTTGTGTTGTGTTGTGTTGTGTTGTGTTGSGTTGNTGGSATGGTVATPARPAASAMGGGR